MKKTTQNIVFSSMHTRKWTLNRLRESIWYLIFLEKQFRTRFIVHLSNTVSLKVINRSGKYRQYLLGGVLLHVRSCLYIHHYTLMIWELIYQSNSTKYEINAQLLCINKGWIVLELTSDTHKEPHANDANIEMIWQFAKFLHTASEVAKADCWVQKSL